MVIKLWEWPPKKHTHQTSGRLVKSEISPPWFDLNFLSLAVGITSWRPPACRPCNLEPFGVKCPWFATAGALHHQGSRNLLTAKAAPLWESQSEGETLEFPSMSEKRANCEDPKGSLKRDRTVFVGWSVQILVVKWPSWNKTIFCNIFALKHPFWKNPHCTFFS